MKFVFGSSWPPISSCRKGSFGFVIVDVACDDNLVVEGGARDCREHSVVISLGVGFDSGVDGRAGGCPTQLSAVVQPASVVYIKNTRPGSSP